MANVSTVDGLGFEEVNQDITNTEIISGTNVYGTNVYGASISGTNIRGTNLIGTTLVSGATLIGNNISGTNIRVGGEGVVHSVSIDNATQLFGYRIKAGSLLMGDSISGLISFPSAGSFSTANYFLVAMARDYGEPQWSRTGSQALYCGSGLRRASGCWIVGGSATTVDWIAVGI